MFGAIVGDVIGSVFENENTRTADFSLFSRASRFTDDTVLTIAVAEAVLHRKISRLQWVENWRNRDLYICKIKEYGRKFPQAGYGQMFQAWLQSDTLRGYHSYANGGAMRVSPIGFAFASIDEVLREARLSAQVTHNHPEGIKGAQAVASAIYYAWQGQGKDYIRAFVEHKFGYKLNRTLDEIRPTYAFDSSCKGSVPQALTAFLESDGFEDAIRKAISLGGDSDTIACMAGGIAQAYYKTIPSQIAGQVSLLLDSGFRQVIRTFNARFGISY